MTFLRERERDRGNLIFDKLFSNNKSLVPSEETRSLTLRNLQAKGILYRKAPQFRQNEVAHLIFTSLSFEGFTFFFENLDHISSIFYYEDIFYYKLQK